MEFAEVPLIAMRLRPAVLIITTICGVLPIPFVSANRRGLVQQQVSVGEWFTFAPEGATFSVTLPATPTEKAIEIESGIKGRSYELKSGGNKYYIVSMTALPDGKKPPESLGLVIKRMVYDLLKSGRQEGRRHLAKTREKDITFGRYAGRELVMESAGDEMDARGYIVDRDLVALAVMHSKRQEASFEARRFFESLSISDSGRADGVRR